MRVVESCQSLAEALRVVIAPMKNGTLRRALVIASRELAALAAPPEAARQWLAERSHGLGGVERLPSIGRATTRVALSVVRAVLEAVEAGDHARLAELQRAAQGGRKRLTDATRPRPAPRRLERF